MQFRIYFLIILFVFSFFSSCSKDDEMIVNDDNISEFSEYEFNVINYFKEIALGSENGTASKITRKWTSTMRIFVDGEVTLANQRALNSIVSEINNLVSDGFEIEIVDNLEQSNYHMFFGSAREFVAIYPYHSERVIENWGLFRFYINESNEIIQGHMYVDIERANEIEQRHLLREELTQSLGLARDSYTYLNSIFQQNWTTTTQYAEIDKDLIRLLYHPDMRIGLNNDEVRPVLEEIIRNQR
ncbi:DUF2927 domain-containing protein [Aquimarina celericrescens]|uniref:DUF2927 domain-containing protein n=1 Tax=Aquimarina celericrescens TaxID=1964542 RepID=A0ABW5AV67_9FLAO|nr:DUF2927 domain-containing protein [Aquimarina celericrescens]